jgi:hypothetical protein
MNAASLILECSHKRFYLLKIDPQLYELQQYNESIIKKEKELNVKEKLLLEAHSKVTKLSLRELCFALDKDTLF